MNLILFTADETQRPLTRTDPRAVHILRVLRLQPGDSFEAGIIEGPRGRGSLVSSNDDALTLSFVWQDILPPPLDPITLVIGRPRPLVAARLLEHLTTIGVCAMHFVASDRGEKSYGQATLWNSDEWRQHLILGAQQAFDTHLPQVTEGRSLVDVLAELGPATCRLALDNYEASESLADVALQAPVVLAFGSERGWSDRERRQLRDDGFVLTHLGERVLRTDTACVAAVSVVKARLGLY